MSQVDLYCRRCDQRYNAAQPLSECPACGEKLVNSAGVAPFNLAETLTRVASEGDGETDPLVNTRLGTYWIEAFMGRGGMAQVYRARHMTLERPCAIKVLRPSLVDRDPDAVAAFFAEARAAAALVHPHVVTLHTISHDRDLHFLEMEFVDGDSLARVVESAGCLAVGHATRLMVEISSALALAHKIGIIHRDVKPANVMVTRSGQAKLADFGLAKRLVAKVGDGGEHVLAGTPHFMAPELFRGCQADRRSDVYAMGVTYYCLLTGRLPIPSETLSELFKIHASETPIELDEISRTAGDPARLVLERCLAYDPQRRYEDAGQLHEEFRALYGSLRSLESLMGEALAGVVAAVEGSGDRFSVSLPLAGGRSQTVFVEACRGGAVAEQLVKIYSVCGPVADGYMRRALELNAELTHGSIAIQDVAGAPHFVMSDAYSRATCDPDEVRQSVLAIAKHADEVEQWLTGRDTH